jgi:CTD small phosphatase-like protein 2
LYEFLVTHVLPATDCRTVLAETFKLREWANFVGPKTAIEKLYF